MGKAKTPQKKKLIIGFIYKDDEVLSKVEALLKRRFGPVDLRSQELPFSHTKYYKEEIGTELKRRFISFERLVKPEKYWKIKLLTNKLEHKFSRNNKRAVNIDPGFISLDKLVLLTTKDYTHRLYLGDGIFGETTLFFKEGSFRPHEHTYPDYKTREYIDFFSSTRDIYRAQLKNNILTNP